MPDLAMARAQADEALEEAAQTIKRRQAQDRKVLHAVRQAQAVLKGISIETTAPGGHSDGITNQAAA